MLLLTNCEVHTGKYSDRSLDVRTERSEVRDSKMELLVQTTTFRPLLSRTKAVDEN